jgi:hypothetical protein
MKLNVHYVQEGATWPQGIVSNIGTDGYALCFDSERKYLIYGVKSDSAESLITTIISSLSKEITISVEEGVGGYFWGITDVEVNGDDENTCVNSIGYIEDVIHNIKRKSEKIEELRAMLDEDKGLSESDRELIKSKLKP